MVFKTFSRNSASNSTAVRIWPIILLGFSCLIVLIGLSGYFAFIRASRTYSGISNLYQSEHDTQESLSAIRADIAESAILLRDFLLDPAVDVGGARVEMEQQHNAAESELRHLRELLPTQESARLEGLRKQTEEYWASLSPVFAGGGARHSYAFIENAIVPRRQASYKLLSEISQLSFEAFLQRRHDIDARTTELAQFLARMVSLTIIIALIVAGISVYRIFTLERIANVQHRQVQAAEDEMRNLSHQLVGAQEEERRALSRDLHDQVGQVLTALRISIGNALLFADEMDLRTLQELELAKRLVAQALRSTRDMAMGLRPTMLDDLGLEAALEWHARQHAKVCGVPVSLDIQAPLSQLSDAQKTCVYRIVQEALNNSAKYAKARSVSVTIGLVGHDVEIDISDDGIGFDTDGYRPGLGLLGMRERVAQLGGRFTVESKPERGTRIRTQLPMIAVNT